MKKYIYENRFLFYGLIIGVIAKYLFEFFGLTLPALWSFVVLILIGLALVPPIFKLDDKFIK